MADDVGGGGVGGGAALREDLREPARHLPHDGGLRGPVEHAVLVGVQRGGDPLDDISRRQGPCSGGSSWTGIIRTCGSGSMGVMAELENVWWSCRPRRASSRSSTIQ